MIIFIHNIDFITHIFSDLEKSTKILEGSEISVFNHYFVIH